MNQINAMPAVSSVGAGLVPRSAAGGLWSLVPLVSALSTEPSASPATSHNRSRQDLSRLRPSIIYFIAELRSGPTRRELGISLL